MDHVSAQGVEERMINYYVILIIMTAFERRTSRIKLFLLLLLCNIDNYYCF